MIAASYKRWRHGRGFGVHSPFAYRFVTDILRRHRGYEYYSSSRLEYLLSGRPRRMRRFCSMIFRMAARLPINAVCPLHTASALPEEVMKRADSRLRFTRAIPEKISPGLLIITEAEAFAEAEMSALATPGIYIIIRNLRRRPTALAEALSCMKGGWIFESPDSAVIITGSATALHHTTVNLP